MPSLGQRGIGDGRAAAPYWQTTDGRRVRLYRGNVFDVLPTLPRGSVDCCVTSPPYWRLRSYLPKDHALKSLELGSEPTPAEYVANMVRVFRLVRDALADHGTCWVNIGDTYAGGGGGNYGNGKSVKSQGGQQLTNVLNRGGFGIDAGSLCLIPQRLAIALSDDGWLVRSCVVWHKPAPMPASVAGWRWCRCRVKVSSKDLSKVNGQKSDVGSGRPQRGFAGHSGGAGLYIPAATWADCPGCPKCEPHGGYVLRRGSWRPTSSWEPVLMLAKKGGYYADGEVVKTPPAPATVSRDQYTRIVTERPDRGDLGRNRPGLKCGPDEQFAVAHDHETVCDSGANLRDVWTIAAEPLRAAHYAAYPTELVARCLKAGTSAKGYCPKCGAPVTRVIDKEAGDVEAHQRPKRTAGMDGGTSTLSLSGNGSKEWAERGSRTNTLGWRPTCSCPDATAPRPGVVLDPFCGSGRTVSAALGLGLCGWGVELNEDFLRDITVPMVEGVLMGSTALSRLLPRRRKPVAFEAGR